jgi:hypothetical protein|tara:strand:- start:54 stop:542 length:489 start_codon:yes stop_codon:yes gene_type:complete
MNKEEMIKVLKNNFFIDGDGHTIFSPDHFIKNGFSPEFVDINTVVHTSGKEPKEKILVNGEVADVLEGIYNLDMLYAIAQLIEADRTIAFSKAGRGYQARALVAAIKDVVQPPEKDWLIRNKNDDSFWNNNDGWTDYSGGTIFSQEERNSFNLPIEGEWEQL